MIAGRKTYDDSIPWWGANGPTGPTRRPLFVVTHSAPAESPEGGVYTFVTGGIESALAQARTVAGEMDISVMGGANIGQQYIAAGLVDEISIYLVPVPFGGGTRMFEHLGDAHIHRELVDTVATPVATHLRYSVVKQTEGVEGCISRRIRHPRADHHRRQSVYGNRNGRWIGTTVGIACLFRICGIQGVLLGLAARGGPFTQ